ncbi:hypothetical protein GCM10022251_29660 [Phytohabitans flavus]|uniref:DUF1707 domain-containing protein n=2 Tax=Phytohabitans flavus TaxID=1076124 RepID=A0A6F8XXK1_9ACTN|nr:hypothetical protein Pflav_048710 [Phytohabitans flavus]
MATILRAAMSEGRLDLAEGEERLAKAYAATYRDELRGLVTDLPDGGRRALADTPEARTMARWALRRHFSGVVVVGAILVGLWVLSGVAFFWPIIPLAFLFLGLAKHASWHRHGGYRQYGDWRGPRGRDWRDRGDWRVEAEYRGSGSCGRGYRDGW